MQLEVVSPDSSGSEIEVSAANGMRAVEIVERAPGPAVLTDRLNRIVALNDAASDLLQRSPASAEGHDFYDLLEARDVFGNRLHSQALAFLEMLSRGEPVATSEVQVTRGSGATVRVRVAVVLVTDSSSAEYEVVYLLQPVRRRRRADEAIERMLSHDLDIDTLSVTEQRNGRVKRAGLTPRQIEVLRLMADGKSATEIAEEFGVSLNTVRTHQHAIFQKLKAHTQLQAVSIAIRHRLI